MARSIRWGAGKLRIHLAELALRQVDADLFAAGVVDERQELHSVIALAAEDDGVLAGGELALQYLGLTEYYEVKQEVHLSVMWSL